MAFTVIVFSNIFVVVAAVRSKKGVPVGITVEQEASEMAL
jgi:hypothetical protein